MNLLENAFVAARKDAFSICNTCRTCREVTVHFHCLGEDATDKTLSMAMRYASEYDTAVGNQDDYRYYEPVKDNEKVKVDRGGKEIWYPRVYCGKKETVPCFKNQPAQ